MKQLFLLILMAFSSTAYGQTILGKWENYDDETKGKIGVIEIYKEGETYSAKIIKNANAATNAICKNCTGAKKNKPIVGLDIIEGIKKNGNKFDGGTILDPESGKVYKCYLKLVDVDKLKVRGFTWLSFVGKTKYLHRKE